MTEKETKYKAPALEKGMAIIELLARTPEGLNLTQISDSLGKSKAEIFRMVAVLNDLHYLEFFKLNAFIGSHSSFIGLLTATRQFTT